MLRTAAVFILAMVATACGGGDDAKGEPLVETTLTATYAGQSFTPTNGFATVYMDKFGVFFGDGAIHCGSETSNSPPPGHSAVFFIDSLAVGIHNSSFTQMFTNVGEFEGIGSNSGTVEITAASGLSIAGTASYSYTDSESRTFGVSGSFETIVCP